MREILRRKQHRHKPEEGDDNEIDPAETVRLEHESAAGNAGKREGKIGLCRDKYSERKFNCSRKDGGSVAELCVFADKCAHSGGDHREEYQSDQHAHLLHSRRNSLRGVYDRRGDYPEQK